MWNTVDIVEAVKPKFVIWENVKNLLSKKHIHNFNSYIEMMDQLGYNSYYQVLNAKDFSIPQNRERVYTISIRKDIDNSNFKFPNKQELKIRIKDILEDSVENKYYLSDKIVEGFQEHNKKHFEKGTGFIWKTKNIDGVANALRANAAICPTDNTINIGEVSKNSQAGQVYSEEGLIPTLTAGTHGYAMGNIMQTYNQVDENYYLTDKQIDKIKNSNFIQEKKRIQESDVYDTLLARDYKNPKCVQVGNLVGGKWDKINESCRRIYSEEGLSPTVHTCQGGNTEPKVMCLNSKSGRNGIEGLQPSLKDRIYDSNGLATTVATSNFFMPNYRVEEKEEVYDKEGLSPTVKKSHGTVATITQRVIESPCIIASRGRNLENNSRKMHQKLEINSQGLCNTLTSVPKDNYVQERYKEFINQKGYISEMYSHYNNEINDIVPTQSAQCSSTTSSATVLINEQINTNLSVVSGQFQPTNKNYNKSGTKREGQMVTENKIIYDKPLEKKEWHRKACEVLNTNGTSTCIHTQSNNLLQKIKVSERFFKQALETYQENDCNNGYTINAFNKSVNNTGISPTVTTRPEGFKTAILPIQNYRIRKLTPKECWRLMGFADEDIEKCISIGISNSQLYKQAR